MNFYAAKKDLEQVFPIARIIAENNVGIRENFEGAAVGDLQQRIAIRAGDDNLAWFNGIA
jgi:hypothetical protein